jgi:hypothetical protein
LIGQQLKTKTHRVYGVHSEPPKTKQNRYQRSTLVLTRQKCGRTFSGVTAKDSSWPSPSKIAKPLSKPLQFPSNALSEQECLSEKN